MKILLLGEYSNVHATLAEGLRQLGHEVTVVSNGDFWKNYPRDIDVSRPAGRMGGVRLLLKVWSLLPRLRGYDVVQLINPMFLELKAERLFAVYRYLRRHNRKVVLCAMGMDYYWVHECITNMPLRYSDFNIGSRLRTDAPALEARQDWLGTAKERLNRMMAEDCDAIVSGLYENHVCYLPHFPKKLHFIPLPLRSSVECRVDSVEFATALGSEEYRVKSEESLSVECRVDSVEFATAYDASTNGRAVANSTLYTLNSTLKGSAVANSKLYTLNSTLKLHLFIGISRGRSAYKGTDIMLRAAEAIKEKYPDRVEILKAEGVPFEQYQNMMDGSDAILDQLYSYTPSMNPLLAMSKGIVCIGGGEPENYAILNETELRPIVNVQPNYKSVFEELEQLVLHPERLPLLKQESMEYVSRHHDYLKVAAQYEELYGKISS